MPSKLYYFRTKRALLKWCRERGYSIRACEEAWRGKGYYYARSRNKISKHDPVLDKKRGGKIGRGPWRHTTDKAIRKTVLRLVKTVTKTVKNHSKKLAARLSEKTKRKITPQKVLKAMKLHAIKRIRRTTIPKSVKQLADAIWDAIPRKYKQGRNRIWTYISVLALAKTIRKHASEKLSDWESVAWEDIIDWSLTYSEAKSMVLRMLGISLSNYDESEEVIIKRLKELEQYMHDKEIDPVREWELKHLY
ncbi:MAG: hypothetical protein QW794_05940 [Thermosphaera sp.]